MFFLFSWIAILELRNLWRYLTFLVCSFALLVLATISPGWGGLHQSRYNCWAPQCLVLQRWRSVIYLEEQRTNQRFDSRWGWCSGGGRPKASWNPSLTCRKKSNGGAIWRSGRGTLEALNRSQRSAKWNRNKAVGWEFKQWNTWQGEDWNRTWSKTQIGKIWKDMKRW